MVTRCRHCDKPLALKETAWTCGPMFCSHYCGVQWAMTKYEEDEYIDEADLWIKAKAYFGDIAEEISREDYGARAEYFTAYSAEYDMCTIFEQIYEGEDLIATSVVGWYFGEQSAECDEKYKGSITATFVD